MTRARALATLQCVVGGGLVAFSMPPWGWWPLAFVGIALLDDLISVPRPWHRFRRGSLFAFVWIMPATLWMWDLTIPGYLIVGPLFAAAFGGGMALVPYRQGRRVALVGVVALWELARWSFPFGGVPLATLAMSQVAGPLGPTVRLLGPLLLVALTVVGGVGLHAIVRRDTPAALVCAAALVITPLLAAVAPRGEDIDEIDVALVQGGGEQGTRALDTSAEEVFERHVEATGLVEGPVDLVVWPENVIDTAERLEQTPKWDILTGLAGDLDAYLIVGVTEDISDSAFVNSAVAISPDGESLDRYEKRIRVPFGEFVPLRALIEPFAPDYLPTRDAAEGQTDSALETPIGDFGVAISWEIFFDTRGRSAALDGGQILVNPTNGSSYWLTIVQTQQIASSRLRAIESGRYVLQVAPTGFSAIVTPDGEVLDRTSISERAVVQGTVALREGNTLATAVGRWPMALASLALVALGIGMGRSELRPRPSP